MLHGNTSILPSAAVKQTVRPIDVPVQRMPPVTVTFCRRYRPSFPGRTSHRLNQRYLRGAARKRISWRGPKKTKPNRSLRRRYRCLLGNGNSLLLAQRFPVRSGGRTRGFYFGRGWHHVELVGGAEIRRSADCYMGSVLPPSSDVYFQYGTGLGRLHHGTPGSHPTRTEPAAGQPASPSGSHSLHANGNPLHD